MGPDGAVNILFRKDLKTAERSRKANGRKLQADYREKFANPYRAAEFRLCRRDHRAVYHTQPLDP